MGGSEWAAVVDDTASVITRENPVVVAAPLLDGAAAAAFKQSAVRLARERPQTDEATAMAREAAQALLSLATGHEEMALRQFLRPDPQVDETTWTVACYQIGDLTPCALLDFASPVAAVTTLAGCSEASHVAAELVASTPTGTRWTALTRTGRDVRFQLPDGRSASDATRENSGELSLAGLHWRDQLGRWANPGSLPEAPVTTVAARAVKIPSAPAPRPPERRRDVGLEHALELVLEALRTVEVRSQPAGSVNDETVKRLDALDRRMSEFQASVEAALERRIQALANYTGELARAFVAQQAATVGRLEARIDEVLARLPSDG